MEIKSSSCIPEIWGGIECTINRVGDTYRDQLQQSNYYNRPDDLQQIISTGIKKMRYPVLWEKHQEDIDGNIDWTFVTQQLGELKQNRITPIVGLLHHGSGPVHTNLLDEGFPDKLAVYAGKVAAQFPWVDYYTPVNEPLTTARFSGLYGFWYPHHRNQCSFVLMLLHQLKGVVLSMQAIRRINPEARLLQTEDLCKVHSTLELAYQADFENERRWLTYDILCGQFNTQHRLWEYMRSLDIPTILLDFFVINPCPPEIMGFNYYITSERYLDDDIQRYPLRMHGGNEQHTYVDTDAARVGHRTGATLLLEEAWQRYHIPMAITECQLNCSREDQVRWLHEIWMQSVLLNKKGIPVLAVTAWAMLGAYDWDSLLVEENGTYESGVFDTGSGLTRSTVLVKMIRAFATGASFNHPLLANQGWWHAASVAASKSEHPAAPIFLMHAKDYSPHHFEHVCSSRRIHYTAHPFGPKSWQTVYTLVNDPGARPWGIILLLPDIRLNKQELLTCQKIIETCKGNGIPVMVCLQAADNATVHLNIRNDLLCLIGDQADLSGKDFLDCAINLLIDESAGCWRWNNNRLEQVKPHFETAVISTS